MVIENVRALSFDNQLAGAARPAGNIPSGQVGAISASNSAPARVSSTRPCATSFGQSVRAGWGLAVLARWRRNRWCRGPPSPWRMSCLPPRVMSWSGRAPGRGWLRGSGCPRSARRRLPPCRRICRFSLRGLLSCRCGCLLLPAALCGAAAIGRVCTRSDRFTLLTGRRACPQGGLCPGLCRAGPAPGRARHLVAGEACGCATQCVRPASRSSPGFPACPVQACRPAAPPCRRGRRGCDQPTLGPVAALVGGLGHAGHAAGRRSHRRLAAGTVAGRRHQRRGG